jgi:hypothetical protein
MKVFLFCFRGGVGGLLNVQDIVEEPVASILNATWCGSHGCYRKWEEGMCQL